MSNEEEFTLSLNNFNSNFSDSFYDFYRGGDFTDITLAAEGQLVKAHRLVLSAASPYFRKMICEMSMGDAFVFVENVSHAVLKNLMELMYCGKVIVNKDALSALVSAAETFQMKDFTVLSTSATSLYAQALVPKVSKPIQSAVSTATKSAQSRLQGNVSRSSLKLESKVGGNEKLAQKRVVSHSITSDIAPVSKRFKNNDPHEPLDLTSQQLITISGAKLSDNESGNTGGVEAVDYNTTFATLGDYGHVKHNVFTNDIVDQNPEIIDPQSLSSRPEMSNYFRYE